MINRRNYYRILHVQPDAPDAVIKASYRTLLQKLKMHPDLGGDHWNATLLNEAYAVLSDPVRRAAYTSELGQQSKQREFTSSKTSAFDTPSMREALACAFCKTRNWNMIRVSGTEIKTLFCTECESPLPNPAMFGEPSWQRAVRRIPSTLTVCYYTRWPTPSFVGHLKNVSPTGACLLGLPGVSISQVIKLECPLLDAVCKIVRGKPSGDSEFPQEIGLHFLAAAFKQTRGTFLSISV
jgi:hypothetical protein